MQELEQCSNISKVVPVTKIKTEYMVKYWDSDDSRYCYLFHNTEKELTDSVRMLHSLGRDIEVYTVQKRDWQIKVNLN